jgi:hypothetical protein
MKRFDRTFFAAIAASAVLAACGTPGAPLPPALELARAVTDLHAVRKGDRVYLAWTVPAQTTDHQTIRHPGPTRICRSLKVEITDCKAPVAEIPAAKFPVPAFNSKKGAAAPKIQASYVDVLTHEVQTQEPTGQITYAVSVLNESGRSAGLSNLVQVLSAPTLPPPEHFNAEVRSDGVMLSWVCPSSTGLADPHIAYKLRIYRRDPSDPRKQTAGNPASKTTTTKIADVNLADCSPPQYLDQTVEWEKHYDYFADAVTIVSIPGKPDAEVEGDDTPVIQAFTHDIFPPATPTGLQAAFSGVGQKPFIDLVWSPDTEADMAGYNVFRHEEGSQPVKLNAEPVKSSAYRDADVQSGHKYFYSVSAVDERNNESAKSDEASEQVP